MHPDFPTKLRLVSHEQSDVHRLGMLALKAVEYNVSDADALREIRDYLRAYPLAWEPPDSDIIAQIRQWERQTRRGSELLIRNHFLGSNPRTGKPAREPLSIGNVIEQVHNCTNNGLRRIDNMLFVDDPQHGLNFFDRGGSSALMGYLRSNADVDFVDGGKYVRPNEVDAELRRTAPRVDGIEQYPHEPPVPGIYYRTTAPQPGDGSHLNRYLDFFRPATPIDRLLMQAEVMTTLWGGPAGSRPSFVHDSDDGRGAGKTKLAEKNGRLVGGMIEVAANEDIGVIKQRLLSPGATTRRVVLVDNVKSLQFSWAELEALITCSTISGKRMYVGEGQRPNLLTWILTLNNASLSTDLAQRCIVIKVAKGDNSGPWDERVNQFIDQHRESIIADAIAALRAKPYRLAKHTRWAAWEAGVLSRLPDPEAAQQLILERQHAADVEQDTASIIEQYFADQLASQGFDPATVQIRIPVAKAAEWYAAATGERAKTTAASRRLHQMSREGQLRRISADPSRKHGRNFIWSGQDSEAVERVDNALVAA